ncbi:hypothetical protein HRI_002380000 [Hibiscus trionum]|uniref:Uncharacterized protein n=1 Tax=Hibiscus trionum TaxID=183268 RepID=A0A9W7M2F9_HIBTR|nr:hypothetical protein HRI_002380000 [Hibiscus trionum]
MTQSSENSGQGFCFAPAGRPPDQQDRVVTDAGGSRAAAGTNAINPTVEEHRMEVEPSPLVHGGIDGGGFGFAGGSSDVEGSIGCAKGKLSFRDTVVGQRSEGQKDNFICDLDVDLEADDVNIGNVGEIPEIKFSERVHRIIDEKLAKSLVVRLLGRPIGYRALHNRVHAMWTGR